MSCGLATPAHAQDQDEATPGLPRSGAPYNAVERTQQPSGNCGIQVNYPHYSTQYKEIHTRVTSFCRDLVLVSNTVSAKTYRSRWFGWQRVSTLDPKTKTSGNVQEHRRTITAPCDKGSQYRYRTEGFGEVSTGAQTFSAASYEQNDNAITCG